MPLVWFRMSIAVALMFIYAFLVKTPLKVSGKTLLKFAVAGLIIALHWLTFYHAIKISNISITLACLSTGAFFASFLEPLLYGRKVILYEVIFGLLVVGGLLIIFNSHGNYIWGMLTALLSAFLSTVFAIINGKFAKEHNPVAISIYELIGGIFFFSLYLLFTGQFSAGFFDVSAADWMWLFILASVCTAYAQIAAVKVMKTVTPYTMMLTINLEPVYGIILARWAFKSSEKMSWTFYLGAAIILITVILNGVMKNRSESSN